MERREGNRFRAEKTLRYLPEALLPTGAEKDSALPNYWSQQLYLERRELEKLSTIQEEEQKFREWVRKRNAKKKTATATEITRPLTVTEKAKDQTKSSTATTGAITTFAIRSRNENERKKGEAEDHKSPALCCIYKECSIQLDAKNINKMGRNNTQNCNIKSIMVSRCSYRHRKGGPSILTIKTKQSFFPIGQIEWSELGHKTLNFRYVGSAVTKVRNIEDDSIDLSTGRVL